MSLDPVLVLALRAGLALVLASAALHKARDLASFVSVVRAFELAPRAAAPVLAGCALAAEVVIAAALVSPGGGRWGAAGAAALLLVYSGAIAVNLARGRRDVDCGCFGPGERQPLRGALLVRNAALVAVAVVALAPASARSLVWLDAVTAACALGALALTWTAASRLLVLAPRLEPLRGRSA